MLCECETWAITKEMRRTEALEMWCYRTMEKINWIDRVTNEDVLERIPERKSIWKIIQKRRNELLGYTLRYKGLLGLILERIIDGKIIEENQDYNTSDNRRSRMQVTPRIEKEV